MPSNNSEHKKNNDSDQDIVYEDNEFDHVSDKKIKKLKKELKKTQAEKDEYLIGWQRSQADYANLKRRSEEEKQNIRKQGTEKIILDILSVVDSFDMAFKDQDAWENAPQNWRTGIESIYNQLMSVLEKNNVKTINPINQEFNPNIHHCVEMIETDQENKDDQIIEVIQKGYMLDEKNIRPAMVKVGKYSN